MLLHLANNAVRTQIHNGLFQKQGSYRQGYGRSEVDSLLRRSWKTLATQSEMLEMLEDKKDMWFGVLEDDSPKVKWVRRVYLRVDYTQAPSTLVC